MKVGVRITPSEKRIDGPSGASGPSATSNVTSTPVAHTTAETTHKEPKLKQTTLSEAPKTAGQNDAPSWATPEYFHRVANSGGKSALLGGSGLSVRLGAMTTTSKVPEPTPQHAAQQAVRGKSLLAEVSQRVSQQFGVMAGRPMTKEEIEQAPAALHLTKPKHVASIMAQGLRPTTGLYKNLTTWFRDAVYMFGKEPTAYQRFANFSTQAGKATATIEIDLKKLDPDKLFKRVLDGAIIYVSDKPIPAAALHVRDA